jgi:hypothetical protein
VGYINTLSVSRIHIVGWYDDQSTGKNFDRKDHGRIKVVFQHLSAGTEEDHEESH